MAEFGINDILNTTRATPDRDTGFREIWLDPYEARPSGSNFYSLEKIEELADSILAVGQQQPTVLARVNGEYRIVSGHRRNLANILNIERGLTERRKIRYLYKEMTEPMFELSLLMGNAYNRELTAWEKTQQAQKLKEALLRAKKEDGLEISGKLRDLVAGIMDESSTNIARMDMIHKNAIPEIKEEFKKGNLGISAAYEASRLPAEAQKAVAAKAGAGGIRAKEIPAPKPPQEVSGPDTPKNWADTAAQTVSTLRALIPYAGRITADERSFLRRLLLRCQGAEKD